jgi:phage-related holin
MGISILFVIIVVITVTPLMTSLIKDNWKIVSHYMLITCGGMDRDLVECDLAFRVLLAVIFPELLELEITWPDNLSEMRSKLFEARGAVFGVILDAAHILVGLAVISMTSDVTVDITRRKTVTEIARRILVYLLISIAAAIAVVVMTTLTTFSSTFVTANAATTTIVIAITTWGMEWVLIVTMLATWML